MSEDSTDSNPEVAAEAELPRFMQAIELYRQALARIAVGTTGTAEEQARRMSDVMASSSKLVGLGQTLDFAKMAPGLAGTTVPGQKAQEMAAELAREDSGIPPEVKAVYEDLYREELAPFLTQPEAVQ